MARQRITIGAFLGIKLNTGSWAYARILGYASYAIYDLITNDIVTSINDIKNSNVLFIVAVYDHAVNTGRWIKIGKAPLEEKFKILPMKYIQDALNPNLFSLYDPNTGDITPANKQDCLMLERAAVWEPEHVEERILDHYANRPNIWLEKMKIK